MADITVNRYLSEGTAVQRAAFTPVPVDESVSGPGEFMLPFFFERDTGNLYLWSENASAWVFVTGTVAIPNTLDPFLLMGG